MERFKIAGIGELLWDVLPGAEELGGAPVNFAYHVSALGAEGVAISTIGNDDRGRRACEELQIRGMSILFISISERFPTGYVTAQLDETGVATYVFPDNVAWDHLRPNSASQDCAKQLSAICFGTLAQRSEAARSAIHGYLKATPSNILKVYDLNLRQHFYTRTTIETSLRLCTVLKLNDDELRILSSMFDLTGTEHEQLAGIRRNYALELVILTKGEQGSILFTDREIAEHPGIAVEVVDTIGAGDSFTAAVVSGLLLNKSLGEINTKANSLAAYVCTRSGAMPPVPDHFRYGK